MSALTEAHEKMLRCEMPLHDYHYKVVDSMLFYYIDADSGTQIPLRYGTKNPFYPVFDSMESAKEAGGSGQVGVLRARELIQLMEDGYNMVLNPHTKNSVTYAHHADLRTMRNIAENLDFVASKFSDLDNSTFIDTYIPYEKDDALIARIQEALKPFADGIEAVGFYRQDSRNPRNGELISGWDVLYIVLSHGDKAAIKAKLTDSLAFLGKEKAPSVQTYMHDEDHPSVRMARDCGRKIWPIQNS